MSPQVELIARYFGPIALNALIIGTVCGIVFGILCGGFLYLQDCHRKKEREKVE